MNTEKIADMVARVTIGLFMLLCLPVVILIGPLVLWDDDPEYWTCLWSYLREALCLIFTPWKPLL